MIKEKSRVKGKLFYCREKEGRLDQIRPEIDLSLLENHLFKRNRFCLRTNKS
jgi:hypothetical protein